MNLKSVNRTGTGKSLDEFKGNHVMFQNSEPPGRGHNTGSQISAIIRAIIFGAEGGSWATPLSDGTKPIFEMVS